MWIPKAPLFSPGVACEHRTDMNARAHSLRPLGPIDRVIEFKDWQSSKDCQSFDSCH